MKLLLLIPAFLLCHRLAAQYIYVSSTNGEIYRLDLANNCRYSLFASCPGSFLSDIAVHPSGKIYVCTLDSLFTIDHTNPTAGPSFLLKFDKYVNALEFGPDGMLYATGSSLLKYDPVTNDYTTLGSLPFNVTSAGDLIFYKNQLYMSATDGSIYEINTTNPQQSTLYYDLSINNIFGMVVMPVGCFNNPILNYRLFAFENSSNNAIAYMIEMETKTAFPVYCKPNLHITGAAATINPPAITGPDFRLINIAIKSNYCKSAMKGEATISMATSSWVYSYSIDQKPDSPNNFFANLSSGLHTLRIKNQFGCYIDTFFTIPYSAEACNDLLFVPDGFTPNGDGKNDIFRAVSFSDLSDFRITVLNRFGQVIYRGLQLNSGWDGRYNQVLQPMGTYVWIINYTNHNSIAVTRKGTVTLIR